MVQSRTEALRFEIDRATRRVLGEQNRDPYAPAFGCFDRRYWGWKLADMPEAALQRNVQPLAWAWSDSSGAYFGDARVREAVEAGLAYALRIQRRDGAFDQAFPNERSVSVTAFMLHAFADVLDRAPTLDAALRARVMEGIVRAADFLSRYDEGHGTIANHQAAVALALTLAAGATGVARYADAAEQRARRMMAQQSREGWFVEYDGADPGYQTLCLYYLALLRGRRPDLVPTPALERALQFLAWCVHPDGTFGGDYGSRRTGLYHPGGIALLGREFPVAAAIARVMGRSITAGLTTTLQDIDVGNLAPLLSSYQLAAAVQGDAADAGRDAGVPCQWIGEADFPDAGLFFRSTASYYAVVGASNGGVLKVFDKGSRRVACDDGGYAGALANGTLVSTQATDRSRPVTAAGDTIEIEAPFYDVANMCPTPWSFGALRLAALVLMPFAAVAEAIKRALVRRLITGKHRRRATLRRRVSFGPSEVAVEDIVRSGGESFAWLGCGRRFSAIHMASSRYFEGATPPAEGARPVDVGTLAVAGELRVSYVIRPAGTVPQAGVFDEAVAPAGPMHPARGDQ
jgi:hypothetical protein